MKVPCVTQFRLYGGLNKKQRQNYLEVPAGSSGTLTGKEMNDLNTEVCTVKFIVDGKLLYVCCAPSALRVEW